MMKLPPAGQCPVGWLAVGWSCYKVNPRFMSWSGAKQACQRSTPGSHLANIKTYADFLSIISFLDITFLPQMFLYN
uniref:C-type lectin domain-containing protein n=1 Tax=Cyprinus carpio TaxID=7962 RepID=A0A8C2I3P7_CYPCA